MLGGDIIKWDYFLTELVYRRFSRPLARFLSRFDVNPNIITIASLITGIYAGYLIYAGRIYWSIVVILISQILDCTDGDLARISGKITELGGYLDRIFDRFVDSALIMGIVSINPSSYWLAGFLAIIGSFGVSISRAMAEAYGVECKVGIGSRDTRIAIVMLGLLFRQYYATLILIAILGFLTTFHRIAHSVKKLADKD
ncbi:Phosphatidylglycerophosphate synthase [Archaeoglobus sulfaticallidus PM70-1]|uniref:Phosphatidylglycerophosphate synthase n=1 Tax=Archaeoglobus sulfaticallidus PM70-1 TaxID=387631 RepID=N0BK48_9EURY|nr:CDP-alcohol phosphatidyltransferase family protein [Archaeoglobus sulfaticallidus]AGK60876.1 Phosphatidylglycerophosphate synthase [Archaeoglobus sulfaticallidus PM70-1]